MPNTVIKLKRSPVPGKIPTTSTLQLGELALNTYDGRLFFKKSVTSTESIVQLNPISVSAISGSTVTDTVTNITSISFDSGSGMSVTNLGSGAVKISSTVTGISLPDQTGNNGKYLATNGSGTSWQALANIPNSALNNSSININGSSVSLGGSLTLTNIPNSSLANSSITINGSSISLGGSINISTSAASLPSQTGNAGKYLYTNGSTATWEVIVGGGSGSATSTILKTFNILNEFTAPLLGTAVFSPYQPDIIRSVQLTNSQRVSGDLMVGLYRNADLLNFFTIPSGNYSASYSGLGYVVNTNDYFTVSVVAGSGINFSMILFNINI
jgi:hypothetical protein